MSRPREADMDAAGIDVAAISIQPMLCHYRAEPALLRRFCRVVNEGIAEMCSASPKRFVPMGNRAVRKLPGQ